MRYIPVFPDVAFRALDNTTLNKEYIPSLALVLNYKCNQVHPLPIVKRIQARCLIDLTKSYTQDFLQ